MHCYDTHGAACQSVCRICREEIGFLFSESSKRSSKALKPDQPTSPTADALEDLLDALSAVYTVFPDLWVDPALK